MANYCSRTARESKDDRSFLDTNKWPNFQHVWMISMTPSEIPLSANVFRDVKLFSPESWWFNAPPESSILSRLNYRLSLRASFVVPFSPSLIAFVSRTHSSPPSAFTSGNANAQIRYTRLHCVFSWQKKWHLNATRFNTRLRLRLPSHQSNTFIS